MLIYKSEFSQIMCADGKIKSKPFSGVKSC